MRNLINSATAIAGMGYEDTEDVAVVMDKAEKMILEVAASRDNNDFTPIKNILLTTFSKIEMLYESRGITGLATGFKDLDKLTSGLQPSDLMLVAARPVWGRPPSR